MLPVYVVPRAVKFMETGRIEVTRLGRAGNRTLLLNGRVYASDEEDIWDIDSANGYTTLLIY